MGEQKLEDKDELIYIVLSSDERSGVPSNVRHTLGPTVLGFTVECLGLELRSNVCSYLKRSAKNKSQNPYFQVNLATH